LPKEWRARNSKAVHLPSSTELSSSENWKLLFTHAPIHRFTGVSYFCRFWLPFLVATSRYRFWLPFCGLNFFMVS
jgi:hypothetical protein